MNAELMTDIFGIRSHGPGDKQLLTVVSTRNVQLDDDDYDDDFHEARVDLEHGVLITEWFVCTTVELGDVVGDLEDDEFEMID